MHYLNQILRALAPIHEEGGNYVMKTSKKLTAVGAIIGVATACTFASISAHASSTHTWNFSYNSSSTTPGVGGVNQQNANHPTVSRRYYSSTGPDAMGVSISGWYGHEDNNSNLNNADGSLRHWNGGLGIDRSSDSHTVDNRGSSDELVAFVFDHAVSLTGLKFGWFENDSDATILYQTDKDQAFTGLGGTSISGLTSNGYSLLGNTYNKGTSMQDLPDDLGGSASSSEPVFSKVWLVGAYLKGVAGNSNGPAGAWDSVKIESLVAYRMPGTSVPLPATILLLIGGLWTLRSRKASTNAMQAVGV